MQRNAAKYFALIGYEPTVLMGASRRSRVPWTPILPVKPPNDGPPTLYWRCAQSGSREAIPSVYLALRDSRRDRRVAPACELTPHARSR